MAKFDEKFLNELRSKLNIVDVIGSYCQLQRKGNSYWACCPLPGHSERTPSFAVNESGQFYKCFGCGKGGDVITFIMEIENLDFREAVKFLCEKANMPVPADDFAASDESTKKKYVDKERLYSLMRDAALFYVANLKKENCLKHVEYLQKRGLTKREIVSFGLGASPDYDSLPKYLAKKGYTYEEMVQSGAVQYHNERKNYYDALGGRLIFPIINVFGKVIAFGGRLLEKSDFVKYKNTSDTALFEKRKNLYNINTIKKEKQARGTLDYVIMVEGYMDTIALFKAGIKNVVASMGTSLTKEQARLIKRYTDTVMICYDGDKAGQNATVRGLEILRENGLEVRVVSLPDGLDPDELINQRGVNAYINCVNQALPLIDFKIESAKSKYDLTTVSGKRKYIDECLKIIGECQNEFLAEELLKKLRDESGITYESLSRDLTRKKSNESEQNSFKKEDSQNAIKNKPDDAAVTAERFVLGSFVCGADYADCSPLDFEYSHPFRQEVAEYIGAKLMLGQAIEADKLKLLAGDDNLSELMCIFNSSEQIDEAARSRYFADCKALLLEKSINEQLKQCNEQFATTDDLEERKKIASKISALAEKLSRINKRR